MLRVKRVYDESSEEDGFRILVDRIWPRNITKYAAGVDLWLREVAPSHELRRWFGHDDQKWDEFKQKYYQELESKESQIKMIRQKLKSGNVTLLFGAKNRIHNNAVALKEFIEHKE
ncbi:MAG: DUF488 family protein [Dehalococcoidales bacterium]|nr:DUF488 family protein [Dehalococcoidales bacterium]